MNRDRVPRTRARQHARRRPGAGRGGCGPRLAAVHRLAIRRAAPGAGPAILAGTVFDTYFAGQIATLSAMAAAPAVVAADEPAMRPTSSASSHRRKAFTGGIGWVDKTGSLSRVEQRAHHRHGATVNVSDRSDFKGVVDTGKPYVSEGVTTLVDGRARGRDGGADARRRRPARAACSPASCSSVPRTRATRKDVRRSSGYAGLAVFDRRAQSVLAGFSKGAEHARSSTRLRRAGPDGGVLDDTEGLAGGRTTSSRTRIRPFPPGPS